MNRLNLWDRILRLFGVKITWEWCVVGCTFGRHSWTVSLEKCRNGTPVIAGGFLDVIQCPNETVARDIQEKFEKVAREFNHRHGYTC